MKSLLEARLTCARAHVAAAGGRQRLGRLVAVSIGVDPRNARRAVLLADAARSIGIRFEQQVWGASVSMARCREYIAELNADPSVAGYLLQPQMPAHLDHCNLTSDIDEAKNICPMWPLFPDATEHAAAGLICDAVLGQDTWARSG